MMGECVLDCYGEGGFQSCEGSNDWSTFSTADWTETQQNNNEFADWEGFQDNTRKEELSTITVAETEALEFPENTNNCDKINPWLIFNNCFQVEEAEKDLVVVEYPTLSQLKQSTSEMHSQSAAVSSEAARFWCNLQSGSAFLRLSGPKPKLYCHEGLLKTLQLRQPATTTVQDLELEDQEEPRGALIQTKLIPSSNCRNAPGFFYQISRQWLNMNLNQHIKDPL